MVSLVAALVGPRDEALLAADLKHDYLIADGGQWQVLADCSLSPAGGSEPLAVHVAANGLARARRKAAGLVAMQRRDSRFSIGFATAHGVRQFMTCKHAILTRQRDMIILLP